MWPRRLGADPRRLRRLLLLVFAGLALPTGALLWQAYGQLKWEAYFQYRSQAEALTDRIDRRLAEDVAAAEGRSFADFSFFSATGDPAGKIVQRSPLAGWPVAGELPGLIGYFQVDPDGGFSTPLVPAAGTDPAIVGIDAGEYAARESRAAEIRRILAENRLVEAPAERELPVREQKASVATAAPPAAPIEMEEADRAPAVRPATEAVNYSQRAFDRLNEPVRQDAEPRTEADIESADEASPPPAAAMGRLQDLRLDDALQKKTESLARDDAVAEEGLATAARDSGAGSRARRIERSASLPAEERVPEPRFGRIETFESEIDPYELSLLDSGHLVLFRKVWRDGDRFIQGMLLERDEFLQRSVADAFREAPLAAMSDLVIGYGDAVLRLVAGRSSGVYRSSAGELDGSLLYRSRLSAPLDRIELIYSINRLPPGPGAAVLGWTALVLAAVFIAGFYALYRLGLGQIRLARQQQDFVSAVSHELKTPLTSIRMYGEMLMQGWADDGKKQQYYAYIHDESERLTRLISNVLKLARISRNEPQVDPKPVAVGELMALVDSKIAGHAERAGYELTIDCDSDARNAVVEIDADCFAQIVINLVDNAIKFSSQSAQKLIEIRASIEKGNTFLLAVRDFGPGIPRDQLRKIFRLFYRPESELTRETVGTGIGLAIVQELTRAMGGRVDAVNRDPGAEFRLRFPARNGPPN